jgi:hypothetical protein
MTLNQIQKILTISSIIFPSLILNIKFADASQISLAKIDSTSKTLLDVKNDNNSHDRSFRLAGIFSSKNGSSKNEQHGNDNNRESHDRDVKARKEKIKLLPRKDRIKEERALRNVLKTQGQRNRGTQHSQIGKR